MKQVKRGLAIFMALIMFLSSGVAGYAAKDEMSSEDMYIETYENSEIQPELSGGAENEQAEESLGLRSEEFHTKRVIPTMFEIGDLNIGSNGGTISRGAWLENLTIMFDMTIESDDLPDSYYVDLTEDSKYYEAAMIAIEFGVIDVEAGGELNLDEPCNRDFVSKTLNYCLGFQLDEGTEYSFEDWEECSDADSAQVAINRGWFSLVKSKFMPRALVNDTEMRKMFSDTKEILESSYVDESFDSQYVFADFVVEIPEGTQVDIDENDVVTITGAEEIIESGDTFVVYFGALPSLYLAEDVTIDGDIMTIETADADEEAAVVSIDASGSVDVDLSQFEEAEGVQALYIETEAQARAAASLYGISVKKNSVVASQTISLGAGASASIVVNLSNLKLNQNIETAKGNYYVTIQGTSTITSSVSLDALEAAGFDKSIVIGTIPVMGVGNVTVSVDFELDGKVTATYTGTFETGFQYQKHSGFRLITNFKKKNFSTDVEANAKIGVQVSFSVDLILVSGSIYATTGMAGKFVSKTYGDGSAPAKCTHISGWLYTTVGAYAKVPGKTFSKTLNVFDENNSPVKVGYHFEDNIRVYSCARGYSFKYFSNDSSPYGCCYYGGASSTGIGSDGEPFTIFTYNLDAENNAILTGYKGNVSALYIPETIDGYNVTEIGGNCFKENQRLRTVTIPNTMKVIGCGAFKDCKNLQSINIPKDMNTGQHMGANYMYPSAFEGCDSLVNVSFEEGITRIPPSLFGGCTGLTDITIPDTVTVIEQAAFKNCPNLTTVTLSENLTDLSPYSFEGCTSLERINLPKTLKVIGCGTFRNCDSLEYVFIPKNMTTGEHMGANYMYPAAFEGCTSLTTVEFEEGITKIPPCLFLNCPGLTEIIIPDTVTEIDGKAFENCSSLTNIELSKYLTILGNNAFASCPLLEKVELPKTITYIGCGAFANCTSISEIFIPQKMDTDNNMGSGGNRGAFYGCENLKEVIFEEGITTIQNGLFQGCTGVESIVIPDTVIKLENYAFKECSNLKNITLSKKMTSIKDSVFEGCTSLEEISVPNTVTEIGYKAFYACESLKKVTLPNTLESLSTSIFDGCSSLKEITLPDTLTSIGDTAFQNSGLEKMIAPKTVTYLGKSAFKNSALSSADFSNCEINLLEGVFENCANLTEVKLGKNISRIDQYAFKNCDSLVTITIPNTVTHFGKQVFYDCDSLKNVTLGTGVTSIPESAFEHCDVLETIILPYAVTSIGNNAFKDSTNFTSITIPKATETIAGSAFSYPAKLTIYGVSNSPAHQFATENGCTFTPINVPATKAALEETQIVINRGSVKKLGLVLEPLNMTDKISWKTSDESIVSVDNNGNVSAKLPGTATIKVIVGSLSATCQVTVLQPVTSVNILQNNLVMDGIKTYQLEVSVSPDNAHNKGIVWTSSDESIITVDQNGLVTVVGEGEADIVATAVDGSGKSDKCHIVVKDTVHYVDSVGKMESPHNYPDNCEDMWVYTLDGAEHIWVSFDERTEVEDGFDYLYIFDGNDNEIAKYTGAELKGKTVGVPGNTAKIKLVSDDGGNAWGFKVTSIEKMVCLNPQTMSVYAENYEPRNSIQGYPHYVLDNNLATFWHTRWTDTPRETHYLIFTFNKIEKINSMYFVQVPGPGINGNVKKFDLYVRSNDTEAWKKIISNGELKNERTWQMISFDEVNAKQVKFQVLDAMSESSSKFAAAAEIRFSATEINVNPGVPDSDVTQVFTDVYKDWYYDYVQYVYDNSLMTGIKGTTLFQPNANITKAQVAQVLYNMENQPTVNDKKAFTDLRDVYESEWYANAVAWAYNTGVVTGDLNTKKFSPNANVTREQLAIMLYRYADYKNYSIDQYSDLSGLKNAENVSNWASSGVCWAVGAGLISGIDKNGVKDLAPHGNANRAQVAAILQRFCEAYNN